MGKSRTAASSQVRTFTESGAVHNVLMDLEQDGIHTKQFSDIVDGRGHQYVDLVLEGGGVLGIALVGYIYVLEQVGIRFLQIAGTSAGSIVALMLAALGSPAETKGAKMIRHLEDVDLLTFVDGDHDARDFVDALVAKAGGFRTLWKAGQVLDNLKTELGLSPGRVFLNWLKAILESEGIRTTSDLEHRLQTLPGSIGIRDRAPMSVEDASPWLTVIAADVTTQTKVQFPDMADLYWLEPSEVNPAEYVRASMSVPFFFEPMVIDQVPSGPMAIRKWRDRAGYREEIPESCTLVDGGTMSNFPINIFHGEGVPTAPTFGAKLKATARRQQVQDPESLGLGIFNAARHTLDFDFVLRNPDYRKLVTEIDTSGHEWLNFGMGTAEKKQLFLRGVEAAKNFLYAFDWEAYKALRAQPIPVAET